MLRWSSEIWEWERHEEPTDGSLQGSSSADVELGILKNKRYPRPVWSLWTDDISPSRKLILMKLHQARVPDSNSLCYLRYPSPFA